MFSPQKLVKIQGIILDLGTSAVLTCTIKQIYVNQVTEVRDEILANLRFKFKLKLY